MNTNLNYTNLDTLRSLAVISVVVQHVWRQCVIYHLCAFNSTTNQLLGNISFTGVMFFFVHTCLVLMLSMRRAPARHFTRNFLVRRFFRIFPLCWATILLALSTGLTDQAGGSLDKLGYGGVISNLLLVQNIQNRFSSVIGPLWSLPWEMQMYLVLPLFFLALRRYSNIIVVLSLWLGATVLAVVVIRPGLPRMFHAALYPPMFIAGMVAYKLLTRRASWIRTGMLPGWCWPFFVLSLFALQAWLVGWHEFESSQGIIYDATICLILAASIPAFSGLQASGIVEATRQVAKYSYGIYLLHVPVLIFVLRHCAGLPLAMEIVIFLVLTTLIAFGSYHAIEDPLIRLGKRLTQEARTPSGYGLESAEACAGERNGPQGTLHIIEG